MVFTPTHQAAEYDTENQNGASPILKRFLIISDYLGSSTAIASSKFDLVFVQKLKKRGQSRLPLPPLSEWPKLRPKQKGFRHEK